MSPGGNGGLFFYSTYRDLQYLQVFLFVFLGVFFGMVVRYFGCCKKMDGIQNRLVRYTEPVSEVYTFG